MGRPFSGNVVRDVWLGDQGAPCPPPDSRTHTQTTIVVLVVGGAQYRTGSHCQCVQPAPFPAQAGYPALRSDLPGMSDSPGELPSFEDTASQIAAAIDGFQQGPPGVECVARWGRYDGASASLLYEDTTHHARSAGPALLSP